MALLELAVIINRLKKLPPDEMETGVMMLLCEIGKRAEPGLARSAIIDIAAMACAHWQDLT